MTNVPAPIARVLAVIFWPIIMLMVLVCILGVKLFQLITTLRGLSAKECLRILGQGFLRPPGDKK
jgi:hypothetical protein